MPIFDRIFTRVGAADDLSKGQSTFMVEMSEVAQILREATPRSLVILDEVGRGTSSQDGLAIASAILENLSQSINCYSLFATHYHELASLADMLPSVKNVQSEVKKEDETVKFTHRLIEGASGSSYGIEVAKLAGVPKLVIDRAKAFLSEPSFSVAVDAQISDDRELSKSPDPKKQLTKNPPPKPLPIESFGLETEVENSNSSEHVALKRLAERISKVNLNKTTPIQALNILDELMGIMDTSQQSPELFHDLTH
jgi:DNA mismatch repair protein MutS